MVNAFAFPTLLIALCNTFLNFLQIFNGYVFVLESNNKNYKRDDFG